MGLILLEALGALVILLLIVWWTMFSGRKGGERGATTQSESFGGTMKETGACHRRARIAR